MAVGKAERAGSAVAGRGEIDPTPLSGLRGVKPRVIDAALMFVDEHKRGGRRWVHDFTQTMPTIPAARIGDRVHVHAHGHAAQTRDPALVAHGRAISRALVDLGRLVVREQETGLDVRGGRVGPGIAQYPGVARRVTLCPSVARERFVGRQAVFVVSEIQLPADLQLADVGQAIHLLGLRFGSMQRRQQQPRQNANDRDDNQEFDQGKGWQETARNGRVLDLREPYLLCGAYRYVAQRLKKPVFKGQ